MVLPILPLSLGEMLTIVWDFMGLLLRIDVDGISREFVPVLTSSDPRAYDNYNASVAELSSFPQALVEPSLTSRSVICHVNPSARGY